MFHSLNGGQQLQHPRAVGSLKAGKTDPAKTVSSSDGAGDHDTKHAGSHRRFPRDCCALGGPGGRREGGVPKTSLRHAQYGREISWGCQVFVWAFRPSQNQMISERTPKGRAWSHGVCGGARVPTLATIPPKWCEPAPVSARNSAAPQTVFAACVLSQRSRSSVTP